MPRPKTPKPERLFVANVQGGWNPKARRWMSADGKLAKKSTVLSADSTVFGRGAVTTLRFPSPISSALDRLEVNLSNLSEVNDPAAPSGLANVLRAALNLSDKPNDKRPADLMPHEISTKMRLSQFFYNSQGDAAQAVDTPVDLLSREIVVDCPDAALGKDLQDFIKESGIYRILPELWRGVREFGQMYPLEVWSGGKVAVHPLDPRSVHVGHNFAIGLGSDVYGERTWSKDLVESRMPPALYNDLFHHWNALQLPWSSKFPIPGNLVRPIQDKAYSFDRYAMPMLSRVFRDLTSIAVHEDAVRVVTEGFRYQLWTFVLGDAEHQPTPLEVTTLQAVIGGIAGERTGSLVWKAPLTVTIHAPQGLDQLIGTDYLRTLTLNLYRKLGVLSRAVSGEAPGSMGGGGGSGGNADLEVRLYLERARFQSNQILDWVSYICDKWARATSKKVGDLKGTTYRFTPSSLEAEALIKNIFGPMYRDGALDHGNYVKAAGLNPAAIVAAKKAEKADRDAGLFDPPTTFAQKVVGAGGETTGEDKTVSQTEPQGRPPADTVQRNDNAPVGA